MGVVQLTTEQMQRIAPLFAHVEETPIWSCLQGQMGNAWADDADAPGCARIITGDFCFFAGDARAQGAEQLVRELPKNGRTGILVPTSPEWQAVIERVYPGRCTKFQRYAIKKKPDVFDRENLGRYAGQLSPEFRIVPIDERLYPVLLAQQWSRDLCSQFSTGEEYVRRGLGFVVMLGGEPVCGASSYTVYNGGIEIEIDTQEQYRRKGLALACAARLILECLDRGLYPSWDAANPASVALAEKLGYHPGDPYTAYYL